MEKYGLGAVVRACCADDGLDSPLRLWVKTQDSWWNDGELSVKFYKLRSITVLNLGYFPDTPEPTGCGAVVKDAQGYVYEEFGVDHSNDRQWKRMNTKQFVPWPCLTQPVDVLFEGIE